MLKAVIMDFDGVIIDTEVVWYRIYVDWFRKNKGYELKVQEFLTCVGSNSDDLFNMLKEKKNILVDQKQFTKDTANLFIEQSSKLPPKEGVVKFIEAVKSRGLKLALATSSMRLKPVKHLTRLGLIDKFDELVTAEEVKRIKPYPDLFLKAAEKLDIPPAQALVIEDSLNGLKAGLSARMRVLMVPNHVTRHSDFKGCYAQAESLANINVDKLLIDF